MTKEVPLRRRGEKRTDYSQRLELLKSEKPRLVVRKHLNNTVAQIFGWKDDGDETLAQAEAQELRNFGWKGHCGNLPSAYLTGYLLGLRAGRESIENAILDLGLQESTKGNRIYAAVKGVINAGLNVPVGDSVLPSSDRVEGKHIEEYASKLSNNEKEKHFSTIMDRGLDPENYSSHFEKTKSKIEEGVSNA